MTKITFYTGENGRIKGFICKGHAGYAEAGEDIVCSAISALVINTINSIEQLTESELEVKADEDGAVIEAFFREQTSDEAELLMRSLVLGITGIKDNGETSEFVDLIFEED